MCSFSLLLLSCTRAREMLLVSENKSHPSLDYRRCSLVFIFMRRTSVNGGSLRKRTRRRRRREKESYWRQTNEWDQWQQFSSVSIHMHSLSLLVLQFFPLYGQKKNSTRKRERKRRKEKERRTRVHTFILQK